MKDNFEQELRTLLDTFEREPAPNTWMRILNKMQFSSSIQKLNFFAPIAAAFLVLCVGSVSMYKDAVKRKPGIVELIMLDTLMFVKGREMFNNNCATCHSRDMISVGTGPALGGVTTRRSKEWLYAFTRNSHAMITSGDSVALLLWRDWQPSIMNNFLSILDKELDTLYYFIEKVSEQQLDTAYSYNYYHKGQMLFDKNCASCHTPYSPTEKIGKSLKGITKKRPKDWLVQFTKDTKSLVLQEDSLALAALGEATVPKLHSFPEASNGDLQTIFDYIEFSVN